MHRRSLQKWQAQESCLRGVIILLGLLAVTPAAMATTDYMFYSVHGDTTATTLVQGDTLAWGANCAIGASLSWSIWYDTDSSGTINVPGDIPLVAFVSTDGDTSSAQDGLPDISPTPDGWFITPSLILGVAPGQYIFRAIDLSDSSSVLKPITCSALPSPPNTISGRILIPGHPAPDPAALKYRWVQAEGGASKEQIWSALTNDSGRYSIAIGSAGTGQMFRVSPVEIAGLVSPAAQMLMAAGHIVNIDFTYSAPVDSIWGFLIDENAAVITRPVRMYCYPDFGSGGKETITQGGRYVFYFGLAELGQWNLGANGEGLIPDYMLPGRLSFDNTHQPGLRYDPVCTSTDTVLYARVTENGNPPAHQYSVYALHGGAQVGTRGVSGIGAQNVVTLHISSLYPNLWGVYVDTHSDDYPIPLGFTVGSNPGPIFEPGDTVDLVLESGLLVSDTIHADPADPTLNWNNVTVSMSGPQWYGVSPDLAGVYQFYVQSGFYSINASAPSCFVNPPAYSVWVTIDTVGGLGFEINRATCHVYGSLSQVPLPLSGSVTVWAHGDFAHPGYQVWAQADMMSGQFDLQLCDGEWTIEPPFISDYLAPLPMVLTIGNLPDTSRLVDLEYAPVVSVEGADESTLPRAVTLLQNHPNPFNPATTIRYFLPEPAVVNLSIYNALGRRVRNLADGIEAAGEHIVTWEGSLESGEAAASGIYLYRLTVGAHVQTRRMLLLK